MFHVELAPLGGIFGPLKSDLGVFWPFRGTDFIMGILKIWDNFLGPHVPILRLMFLEFLRNFWTFGINKKDGCFFQFRTPSGHMWWALIFLHGTCLWAVICFAHILSVSCFFFFKNLVDELCFLHRKWIFTSIYHKWSIKGNIQLWAYWTVH